MSQISRVVAISALVVGVVDLSGCDSHSEPSQENFKAAVQTYLDKQPAVCAQSPAVAFPFDAPKSVHLGVDDFDRAQALI